MKFLLTSIGNLPSYKRIKYSLPGSKDKSWTGKLAGIAVGNLYGPFDEILVFCTEETCRYFGEFRDECIDNSLPDPKEHLIPSGASDEEQWSVIEEVIDAVLDISKGLDSPARLTLDITSSYRQLPLLYFTAISYLTSFHESLLEKVVYGKVDTSASTATLVDTTSAFRVIEWYHAANMFTKTGDVQALQRLVERRKEDLRDTGEDFREVDSIRKALSGVTNYLGAALPIELGMKARGVRHELETVQDSPASLPLFRHLLGDIRGITASCAFDEKVTKDSIQLTKREIRRQIEIIRQALKFGQVRNALTMTRETLLNKTLLHYDPENWLETATRRTASHRLSALSKRVSDTGLSDSLTPLQQEAGRLWDEITQQRNLLAHCGYSHNKVSIEDFEEDAEGIFERVSKIDLSNIWEDYERKEELLVCPLGYSKGAMFSALRHTSPDTMLAIVSPKTTANLSEVVETAHIPGLDVSQLVVDDPYRSFDEIDSLVNEHTGLLSRSTKTLVHVVGGTTMMTELSRAFARKARDLGIPMEVFATVDSREHEEQMKNPYVLGEYITLERWPDSNGD